jgi:hypothetical protein
MRDDAPRTVSKEHAAWAARLPLHVLKALPASGFEFLDPSPRGWRRLDVIRAALIRAITNDGACTIAEAVEALRATVDRPIRDGAETRFALRSVLWLSRKSSGAVKAGISDGDLRGLPRVVVIGIRSVADDATVRFRDQTGGKSRCSTSVGGGAAVSLSPAPPPPLMLP